MIPALVTHVKIDPPDNRLKTGSEADFTGIICVQDNVPPCVQHVYMPDLRSYPGPCGGLALDTRPSTESANVETANHTAARIRKVWDTVSRKGDSIANRPHRRPAIVFRPSEVEVVPASMFRRLAALLPFPGAASAPALSYGDRKKDGPGEAAPVRAPPRQGPMFSTAANSHHGPSSPSDQRIRRYPKKR